MGSLVDRLLTLCSAKSVAAEPFLTAPAFDDRLVRRTKALSRAGLLLEYKPVKTSIEFLLGATSTDTRHEVIRVVALPSTRIYNVLTKRYHEDLPVSARLGAETARMETLDVPDSGWEVDIEARTCPCNAFYKSGCCVHLLYALGSVGSMDTSGRDTLVYRGPNKRVSTNAQSSGRPSLNGQALSTE